MTLDNDHDKRKDTYKYKLALASNRKPSGLVKYCIKLSFTKLDKVFLSKNDL